MDVLGFILVAAVAALWFFTNEYPTLFGVYVPVYDMKPFRFRCIIIFFLAAAVVLRGYSGGGIQSSLSVFTVMSSLIVLSLLKLFGIHGSAVYALLGSSIAYEWLNGSYRSCTFDFVQAIVVAPVIAFILSFATRYLLKKALDRSHIHIIRLSIFFRNAITVVLVMTALALGVNWGGFLSGIEYVMIGNEGLPWMTVLILVSISFLCVPIMKDGMSRNAAYDTLPMYAVFSIGLSVSLTLLFFSFVTTTSFIGLCPIPLSVTSLVFASVAGTEVAQKSKVIEGEEYLKEIVAMLAVPAISFILTYIILTVTKRSHSSVVTDFTVIAGSVLVLLIIFFAEYVRRNRSQREITDRLVYSQQQQIYEHSRALNDMELKVVLSENQALHNAIEMKKQEVMNVALSIVEQKEYLESLNTIVKKLEKSTDGKEKDRLISELSSSLKQRLSYEADVDSQYFYAQAEYLHEDFNAKLSENFPNLTQQERRLATLLRLGFSSKYIATLMNITPKSVEISRYRLRQKLGLSKGDNLVNFIKSI